MSLVEKITLWQTIFTAATFVVAAVGAFLAYKIGKQQIKINEIALKINDFSEIFLMPQVIVLKQLDGTESIAGYYILIKNASSYPIYLDSYNLNNIETNVGGSVIPHNSESWYSVLISAEIQDLGEFTLIVKFETYMGKKYKMTGNGKFIGQGWSIKTSKRIELH